MVSNQNFSRGWTFRANATRKWIFQKNLQREPILVLINTKNLFSTFWVIFSQNLKTILGFKQVTWIYNKSTIKLFFCQVITKNSLFSGHHKCRSLCRFFWNYHFLVAFPLKFHLLLEFWLEIEIKLPSTSGAVCLLCLNSNI